MVFSLSSQHILGALFSKTEKTKGKKSVATVLKSMASFSNLLPTLATFIGFARTVKIRFDETIGLT